MKNFMYKSLALMAVGVAAMCAPVTAVAWDLTGHDVTAEIASRHLTPTSAAAIDDLLDGRSIVYWAYWLENASYNDPYKYTLPWHSLFVDEGFTYDTAPRNPKGDLVSGITLSIDNLFDPGNDKSQRADALKMIVHLVADLHQPLHCGHASDNGASKLTVNYFGYDRYLHYVFDYSMVSTGHDWDYTEWANNIDHSATIVPCGDINTSLDDWARENIALAAEIYNAFPAGSSISFNQLDEWLPLIESRLLTGGLRLAHLLNVIFDPEYSHSVGGVNSIVDRPLNDTPSEVYDIRGIRCSDPDNLRPGIYIVGNEKHLVK